MLRETSEEREREREIKRGAVRREGKSLYTESLYIHIYIYILREREPISVEERSIESLLETLRRVTIIYIYIERERERVYIEKGA